MQTRGVFFVHSSPAVLCPHVEWATAGFLGIPVHLDWRPQPAEPGTLRAELSWHGRVGASEQLASSLSRWRRIRFEVTEEATSASEAHRISYTPRLGLFRALTSPSGDMLIPEGRLKAAMVATEGGGRSLRDALDDLLGVPWDDELEPFRHAGEASPVRWLHQVV